MVRKLADEGMTVLMVEHRVEDVLRIRPSRVMFMREGEIRYLGPRERFVRTSGLPRGQTACRGYRDGGRGAMPRRSRLDILPGVAAQARDEAPLVRFENVAFGYEAEAEVLHGINLDIHSGDVIAVLGANGAGKTTLGQARHRAAEAAFGPSARGRQRHEGGQCRPDCLHPGLCVPESEPHALCADGARGAGVWTQPI